MQAIGTQCVVVVVVHETLQGSYCYKPSKKLGFVVIVYAGLFPMFMKLQCLLFHLLSILIVVPSAAHVEKSHLSVGSIASACIFLG